MRNLLLLGTVFTVGAAHASNHLSADHPSSLSDVEYVSTRDNVPARDFQGNCLKSYTYGQDASLTGCDAPAAAPVAARPAPKVEKQKIVLETKTLFPFGKAELRPAGQRTIKEIASEVRTKTVTNDEIVITGHSDRIGNTAFNQELSERRAAAAKEMLIESGIPADIIQTQGRGSSQPVTGKACNGKTGKALTDCLESDRRVEIRVNGEG